MNTLEEWLKYNLDACPDGSISSLSQRLARAMTLEHEVVFDLLIQSSLRFKDAQIVDAAVRVVTERYVGREWEDLSEAIGELEDVLRARGHGNRLPAEGKHD